MPNKYEKVTEAGKIIPNILANISAGIEAGKKPLDALFKDTDKVVDKFYQDIDKIGFKKRNKSLDPYIKTLIDKIEGLERSERMWKKINIIKKSYIRDLNNRNIKLKKENIVLTGALHKAGELIEEIKNDNFETRSELAELCEICTMDQLAEFAYILKRKEEDNNKGGK